MAQTIYLKLQSFDQRLVHRATERIVNVVEPTGALIRGPIPMPTKKEKFTVLRSPHVQKKSREQFKLHTYKRLLQIEATSSATIDALSKLALPVGVDIMIKS